MLLGLLVPSAAPAQTSGLFAIDEPLVLRLEAPLRRAFSNRYDPEYEPARITVADGRGGTVTVDARVRVRGKSRARECEFPPLLLNFPRNNQPEGSPFAGENRLKLVTHCRSSASHEPYVLLERQIYQALNLLTDASLRTRLARVTYFDPDEEREVADRIGFFIEDEERFAERSGLSVVSLERVEASSYDARAHALLDVFEYFIGNTDWSAIAGAAGEPCCHNVVPFARADGVRVPVPYDFDSSGLVNAPRASPDPRLPIQSVRDRLYRGSCRDLSELEPTFETFRSRRSALTALFTIAAGLPERSAARAREYIDEFYAVLGDARRAERAFRINCLR